jgi:hypothetical protein
MKERMGRRRERDITLCAKMLTAELLIRSATVLGILAPDINERTRINVKDPLKTIHNHTSPFITAPPYHTIHDDMTIQYIKN